MSMVSILLGTYNGEQYIAEQINSILAQTYLNWKLYIRDDGSSDKTLGILNDFAKRYPDNIQVVNDKESKNLGAKGNFLRLLEYADTDYIMFCDQDDIWLPHKIAKTMQTLELVERRVGRSTPILVHTDLKVVDERLNIVSQSLWHHQFLNPKNGTRLNRLLVQNVVTGCTTMINKALKEKVGDLPDGAVMHDWWLALVASAFGKIAYLSEPTVLYRQHGGNEIGAKKYRRGIRFTLLRTRMRIKSIFKGDWTAYNELIKSRIHVRDQRLSLRRQDIEMKKLQAKVFAEYYVTELDKSMLNMCNNFAAIGRYHYIRRIWLLFKYRIFETGILRNISLIMNV